MRTKNELYREALRQVASRRQRAVTQAQERRAGALAALPRLGELEAQVRALGLRTMELAAKGAPEAERQAVAEQRRQTQADINRLLAENGYSPQSLEPRYVCPDCQDTGMVNGRLCPCVGKLARQLRWQEISEETPLSLCSFESMDLSFYPDAVDPATGENIRALMRDNLNYLQAYAREFDLKSANLLLYGNAGLGKTHAALSIAKIVLEKGFNVVYICAQNLFSQLERERFADSCPLLEAVMEADLLILDDLGTEYVNPYMSSCFYNLLNTRILEKRPTIYTTNIVDGKAFEARYTEKIASRLGGSCEPVLFLGQDIRGLKSRM